MSRSLPIDKVALKDGAVRPMERTLTVTFVLTKGTVVDAAVMPTVNATSVALIEFVFTFIRVAIVKGGAAVPMPAAVAPGR